MANTTAARTPLVARPNGPHAPPAIRFRYVRIPQRLLIAAAYTPLTVGVYSLIARLFLVAQAPVALSASDVKGYDPTLSRGAVQRVLSKLVDQGWLLAHEQPGRKTTYQPTWGRVHGAAVPWRVGTPDWDRPRHIGSVCLDVRLLDLFLGKLTCHPTRAAIVTRYVTAPLLQLSDVGGYALLLGGLPGTTPQLTAWGLARDDQPLPVPDDNEILARASQRPLVAEHGPTLTARGWQKVGLTQPAAPASSAQTLFFLTTEQFRNLPTRVIGRVITKNDSSEVPSTASQCAETSLPESSEKITWESRGIMRNPTDSTPLPPTPPKGGGKTSTLHKSSARARAARRAAAAPPPAAAAPPPAPATQDAMPDTESVRALAAINVLPDQRRELADMPLAVVNAAIRDGQARPYVRDLAGWVVKLLRSHRDYNWQIRPPAPQHESREELDEAFRAYAAQQAAERARVAVDHAECGPAAAPTPVIDPPCPSAPAPVAPPSLAEIWTQARELLRMRLPRRVTGAWLRESGLIACRDGTAVVAVPSVAVKDAVEREAIYALNAVLRELLQEHVLVRVILTASLPAHLRPVPDGPSSPAQQHDNAP